MLNTGVSRPIDVLGRITIPKELRESLDLDAYEPIDISINNGSLELKHFDKNLKEIGIFRNLDSLGRVVIPMEIRKMFDIEPCDRLLLKVKGKTIIGDIVKSSANCRCCKRYFPLIKYNNMTLCDECIKGFSKELERSMKNV